MFKRLDIVLSLVLVMFLSVQSLNALTIIEAKGDLETAIVKWKPEKKIDRYNVYYTGQGIKNQRVDDYLIRNYGSYYRVDIPGLEKGSYVVKIVAVKNGKEGKTVKTNEITVLSHERIGFAFSKNRIPGAYKMDGIPKKDALVLYVTDNNKDSIRVNVNGANHNPCIGIQQILDGFKKGKDIRPLIVRFVGCVNVPEYTLNGDLVVENKNNAESSITLEGIGNDAVANGWGIRIKHGSNIEIRNLGFINCHSEEGDNIGLQQDNEYVWVHNCDFFYGGPGDDADQVKGDGALDCKKSTYVTFSYNHFWDNGKSCLLGFKEDSNEGLYATYHHNWFDHSDSRHPRVRSFSAHIFNNYFDGNCKYGVAAMLGSSVFVESNYFRNCKYPMEISMQGSDIYYGNPTFSMEDGGMIKAYNNYMIGQKHFFAYGNSESENSTVDFDAYAVTDRDQALDSAIVSKQGGNFYNNFDTTSSVMYDYDVDTPEQARDKVIKYAGRVEGGDLKWKFNNDEDDESHDINTGLKTAVKSYKANLVFIQGEKK